MPKKIIIDTDPGIDDAMAIFFALRSPELDVIGLTSIFGNVSTRLATRNALRLLEIAGRADIPVAAGVDNPLTVPFKGPVPHVHGDDGQGNIGLTAPRTQPIAQRAPEFIVEQIMAAPGEITLVPVGPLTNIAMALHLEPRIAENVAEVVLMGGNALGPGNATPAAEANIHNDPEAADLVFGAPWQVTMVGLDATHKVFASTDYLQGYAQADNPMAQHINAILPHYLNFYELYYPGIGGMYVHDSSAIGYVIDPSLFRVERWPVRVETLGISRGKTWPMVARGDDDNPPAWRGRPLVNVCVDADGDRLLALEMERVAG